MVEPTRSSLILFKREVLLSLYSDVAKDLQLKQQITFDSLS